MVYTSEAIKGFINMCNDGWHAGWHERNGGNLTYRMRHDEIQAIRGELTSKTDWLDIGVVAENMAGEYFLTTGTGKYFRHIKDDPETNIGIVEISRCGGKYRIVWGLKGDGRPTSEFPSHFMNHSVRAAVTGGTSRVIYHAHPSCVIALTNVLPLTSRDFSRALWKSMAECPVVFPRGVGVMPWQLQGGTEIAKASCKLMEHYDAIIWAHHGMFCAGDTFDETFGLMHTIEKAADVFMRVLSCGQGFRQTLTDQNLREIASAFGASLNEEFLD